MVVGILLIQAVTFAVLSAIIASNKNRSAAGWGALGFLFGLFGFIAAIAVGEAEDDTRSSRRQSSRKKRTSSKKKQKPSGKEQGQSPSQDFDPDQHEKKCPDCAEYIKLEAHVCKHCGHRFPDEEVEQQITRKRKEEVGNKENDREEEAVNIDNLTRSERYYLSTHNFSEESDECEECGVSKSYITENRYKCRYSNQD